jgi:hypothetical protein
MVGAIQQIRHGFGRGAHRPQKELDRHRGVDHHHRPSRTSPSLAGQELGERDSLPGGADPELAVNLVRDVADLDHLRHVMRIFTCAKHVKLGHAPATPRQTL